MRPVARQGLLVLMSMMLLSCESADEYTPKNYVSLLVANTVPLKVEIAKSLMIHPDRPVAQAGQLQTSLPIGQDSMKFDFGWVTAGGAIIMQNTKFAVLIVQEPTLSGRTVKWSCIVHPVEAKPNLCGSEYQNSLLQNK